MTTPLTELDQLETELTKFNRWCAIASSSPEYAGMNARRKRVLEKIKEHRELTVSEQQALEN